VSWKAVPGAVAYNVRWGIQKDKLYQTYQVFADQPPSLEVRALTLGENYFFAIEAFNENGVSKLSEVIATPATSRQD
jgi:xylan 1,4-beta-xylosidase